MTRIWGSYMLLVIGSRGGTFLSGAANDLANMEAAFEATLFNAELFNTLRYFYLTKFAALGHTRRL